MREKESVDRKLESFQVRMQTETIIHIIMMECSFSPLPRLLDLAKDLQLLDSVENPFPELIELKEQ